MLLVSLDKFIFYLIFRFVGKTTIADALVASNGIISQRMAGKVSLVYVSLSSSAIELVDTWNSRVCNSKEIASCLLKRQELLKKYHKTKSSLTRLNSCQVNPVEYLSPPYPLP